MEESHSLLLFKSVGTICDQHVRSTYFKHAQRFILCLIIINYWQWLNTISRGHCESATAVSSPSLPAQIWLPQSITPSCTISRHRVVPRRTTPWAWRAQTVWRPASPPATPPVLQKGERLGNVQLALFPWEHSSLPRLPGEGSLCFVPVTTCFVTCLLLWLVHRLLPCQPLQVSSLSWS